MILSWRPRLRPTGDPGKRSFFMDTAGKVHGDDKRGKVATVDDPLIAGEKAADEKST